MIRLDGRSPRGRTGASAAVRRGVRFLICAVCCLGCSKGGPASPDKQAIAASELDRLQIFVRDWPDEYVEIDFRRNAGESTLIIFRPPQPGVPRVLLDSIGPSREDPEEIVELLKNFNVWALAEPNAPGAACRTIQGSWSCFPTVNDYSLVMRVISGGVTRNQRYTRLELSTSNQTARALGDLVLGWARERQGGRS